MVNARKQNNKKDEVAKIGSVELIPHGLAWLVQLWLQRAWCYFILRLRVYSAVDQGVEMAWGGRVEEREESKMHCRSVHVYAG